MPTAAGLNHFVTESRHSHTYDVAPDVICENLLSAVKSILKAEEQGNNIAEEQWNNRADKQISR
jgi:hypothetical protein